MALLQLIAPKHRLSESANDVAFVGQGSATLAAGVERMFRLLPDEDRRLAELLYIHGLSYRRVARAMRWPQATARRRVLRLRGRLFDPVARATAAGLDALDADSRGFAVELLILGRSERAIARARGLSRRTAQHRADLIRGWARGLLARPRRDADDAERTRPGVTV